MVIETKNKKLHCYFCKKEIYVANPVVELDKRRIQVCHKICLYKKMILDAEWTFFTEC